ncbi:hypothetical protein Tco_1375105 [Tanacetum coccineum]
MSDGGRMDEVILNVLCILNCLLHILIEGLEIIDFLLNPFLFRGLSIGSSSCVEMRESWFKGCSLLELFGGVEKIRALGANGIARGSTIEFVWIEVKGGMVRAKVVSMVEEQALDAMELLECIKMIRKRDLQLLRCEDDGGFSPNL